FPGSLGAHTEARVGAAEPELIAPIVDFDGDRAVLDERHRDKQPDWTYDAVDSGKSPADRFDQAAEAG
ncbi:MAG: hypothetical protein ACRDZV_16365, partial [Acidimicrobiia bacterium]